VLFVGHGQALGQAVERGMAGEETRIQGKRYTDRIRDRILGLGAQLAAEGQESFERSTRHVERTRWVVAALGGAALALMAILFLLLQRQLQLREQIADLLQGENQRLDALVRERTDELSDLASYLSDAREAEKARLARELHDELGSLLTAAKMQTGSLARQLDGTDLAPCRERLARLEEILDSGIALKRRIIDGLRPPLLEELGLISSLRILGEEFARGAEETLSLELPAEEVSLAPAPALALYRIAQEALNNALKHARARQIGVHLRRVDGAGGADGETRMAVALTVRDDGRGFDPLAGPPNDGRQHFGLKIMAARAERLGGQLDIQSAPGAGTRVRLTWPLRV